MVDELKSEEEIFSPDEVVRDLSLKYSETSPALSCHSCGEEIDSEEFVNEEKLFCSEECIEREIQSGLPVVSTRRRVSYSLLNTFLIVNVSQWCVGYEMMIDKQQG